MKTAPYRRPVRRVLKEVAIGNRCRLGEPLGCPDLARDLRLLEIDPYAPPRSPDHGVYLMIDLAARKPIYVGSSTLAKTYGVEGRLKRHRDGEKVNRLRFKLDIELFQYDHQIRPIVLIQHRFLTKTIAEDFEYSAMRYFHTVEPEGQNFVCPTPGPVSLEELRRLKSKVDYALQSMERENERSARCP